MAMGTYPKTNNMSLMLAQLLPSKNWACQQFSLGRVIVGTFSRWGSCSFVGCGNHCPFEFSQMTKGKNYLSMGPWGWAFCWRSRGLTQDCPQRFPPFTLWQSFVWWNIILQISDELSTIHPFWAKMAAINWYPTPFSLIFQTSIKTNTPSVGMKSTYMQIFQPSFFYLF